jgi:LAGLIDADG DNA endonuclease family protein
VTGWTVKQRLSYYSDIVINKPYSMRKNLFFFFGKISKCSSLNYMVEKYLLVPSGRRLFAWLIKLNISHQRLNVGHLTSNLSTLQMNMNKFTLSENKEIFHQWLVGFTDGDGTFSINRQSKGKWSLTFKLSQSTYNLRLLYFIKRQLGVGQINIEQNNNMANFRIRDRLILKSIIFPIFDKYPLLTTKYFNYIKFKEAYSILTDNSLSITEKDTIMTKFINSKPPVNYISPAWLLVDNNVIDFESASKVMSKPWLIGFTEAEGSFYLVSKTANRLVHAFEISQKLDKIVLVAIKYILGISTNVKTFKSGSLSIVTTNSRAIENIIKFYKNTMKGVKSLEYRIWARAYAKYKGNFVALNNIRNRVRLIRKRTNTLDKLD